MERKRLELTAGSEPRGPGGVTCEGCAHYADVGTGGECREDSPKGIMVPTDSMGGMAAIGFWPSTRPDRWCGKHKHKLSD